MTNYDYQEPTNDEENMLHASNNN